MHIKPKHIALFGNFGSDNLGNEASLEAMLDLIRRERPEAQITCICHGLERAAKEHRIATIPITQPFPTRRWLKILDRLLVGFPFRLLDIIRTMRAVRNFDVLVIPGTGILDDFSERWQAMPYDLFKWSVAAKMNRRPFAFVSIGAGPILHPISRWLMTSAARMARYRSYRDDASKDYMRTFSPHGQDDPVFPDLVFELPVPECTPKQLQDGQPPTIGVGVMHYFGWDKTSASRPQIHETYISRMTEFTCWLLQRGYRVRLLMGAFSDQRSFDDIIQRVIANCDPPVSANLIAEPASSMHDLMQQICETELIVATRFHNIVAAMKMGRPAISIGYAGKNDVLLAQVGLEAFCQSAEQLDVARLIAQFERLIRERDQFADRIRNTTQRYRENLERQAAYLLAQLL